MDPTEVRFPLSKLIDEQLEFGTELICGSLVLMYGFDSVDDVGFPVGCLVILFETGDEFGKGRERFDVFVCVDVPHLCIPTKPGSSKTSLECLRDSCKLHILLYAEHPSGDVAK